MGIYDRDYIQDSRAVGAFSTRVYGWMSIGLGFTAAVAYFLFKTGLYISLMPFWWVWRSFLLGWIFYGTVNKLG